MLGVLEVIVLPGTNVIGVLTRQWLQQLSSRTQFQHCLCPQAHVFCQLPRPGDLALSHSQHQ